MYPIYKLISNTYRDVKGSERWKCKGVCEDCLAWRMRRRKRKLEAQGKSGLSEWQSFHLDYDKGKGSEVWKYEEKLNGVSGKRFI